MERPFYGRTGVLPSGRDGAPVRDGAGTKRLPPAVALKWAPTLLTAPQAVLDRFQAGGSVDTSLLAVLRLGTVVDAIERSLRLSRAESASVLRRALQWRRDGCAATPAGQAALRGPVSLSWYLPDYKLLVVKDGATIGSAGMVSQRAVTLMGKDPAVNDVLLAHPSCSGQHAALEVAFSLPEDIADELDSEVAALARAASVDDFRLTVLRDDEQLHSLLGALCESLATRERQAAADAADDDTESAEEDATGEAAARLWSLELRLVDLGSTNGTAVNGTRLTPQTRVTLIEGDVVTFGASSRQYVVMRAAAL